MTVQQAFFRKEVDGTWAYRSMPHRVVGGGYDTSTKARRAYRGGLMLLQDTDNPAELPPVVEHMEVPVGPDVWVRTAKDDEAAEREEVAIRFNTIYSLDPSAMQNLARDAIASTGDAVVVAVLPTDTVHFVLNQMSDNDALYVVMTIDDLAPNMSACWVMMLGGSRAEVTSLRPTETLGDAHIDGTSTMLDLQRQSGWKEARETLAAGRSIPDSPEALYSAGTGFRVPSRA